jgi:membrane protease subunit HflC
MKKNPLTLTVALLLLLAFVALLFMFQVRQSEVAVVTTFGKPTRDINTPGQLYFKWPWPIQYVYKLDQRIQNFDEDKFDEVTTADKFTLLISVYAGWNISDPKAFFPRFAGENKIPEAEKALKELIRNAKSAVIGKHPLADLVNTDPERLKFDSIEKEIQEAVQTQLAANNYGLQLDFLGIKKLGLPESVTTAVFERMKSEREVLISKTQFEGDAEAAKIKSNAEREAAGKLNFAEAQATEVKGKGEAEAAKSLAVFQQNPELATFLFRLSALESSLKERTTLIFDQSTPPFNLFRGLTPATAAPVPDATAPKR